MKFLGIGAPELGIILLLLIPAVIFGCIAQNFGKKKGYGEGICFAAGFALGIIGLIIVLLLPDKNADAPSKLDDCSNTNNCSIPAL
jgi:hypothetical protein